MKTMKKEIKRILSTHLKGPAVLQEAESLSRTIVILHQLKLPEFDHLITATRHKSTLRVHSKCMSKRDSFLDFTEYGQSHLMRLDSPTFILFLHTDNPDH